MQQGDAIAMLGLVHVVRGDQDGAALAGQTVDEVPEVAARGGVHTARRLVQQEDRWTMDRHTAQRQTLTPSAGEVRRERLLSPMQAGPGAASQSCVSPSILTMPAEPLTVMCCPVEMCSVAPGTPTTAGMPYSRATTEP
jgi:hypothetical protein